jgi:hypothetical protein
LFNTALNPKGIVKDFIYSEIMVMKSKKVPLYMQMMNAQPGGQMIDVLFKNGDDLR